MKTYNEINAVNNAVRPVSGRRFKQQTGLQNNAANEEYTPPILRKHHCHESAEALEPQEAPFIAFTGLCDFIGYVCKLMLRWDDRAMFIKGCIALIIVAIIYKCF